LKPAEHVVETWLENQGEEYLIISLTSFRFISSINGSQIPEGEMKSVEYEALARSQTVRDALSAFSTLAGLPIKLVSCGAEEDGKFAGWHSNQFCQLMASTERGRLACQETLAELQHQLEQKPALRTWQCFAGFTKLAVPVMAHRRPVATVVCEGFFQRKPTPADFDRCVQRLGQTGPEVNLTRARTAYFASELVSGVRLRAIRRLLMTLADHLGEIAGHCLLKRRDSDPPCVSCAKAFVVKHGDQMPRTRDVARAAHVTEPYFCRVFKAATGMHFSEYVARCHVDNAKDLLRDTKLHVTEVAFRSGFRSIPHFNHAFKRYTGLSPTGYRASLQP
jgi:AraC-like DNA-binding protein/ligand-binding sensor protein